MSAYGTGHIASNGKEGAIVAVANEALYDLMHVKPALLD
jgi:hypothetical protein